MNLKCYRTRVLLQWLYGCWRHVLMTCVLLFSAAKLVASDSLYFNGATNYMQFSGSFATGASAFTLEFWFKPDSYQNSTIYSFNGRNYTELPYQSLELNISGSSVSFTPQLVGGYSEPTVTTGSIYAGQWQHMAIVQDEYYNGYLFCTYSLVYINGFLAYSNGIINNIPKDILWGNGYKSTDAPGFTFYLGGDCQSFGSWYKGAIGELRTWGYARSQAEIQTNMFQVLNPTNELGLTGYWRFNEGSGNIVHDLVGGNDGTIYGATWDSDVPGQALQPPSIIQSPTNQTVFSGALNISFNVGVSGSPPFLYQWMLNGTNLNSSNYVGATSSSLSIQKAGVADLGAYSVMVSNVVGSATSSNATLNMYPFLQSPFNGALAIWGKDAALTVGPAGTGPFSYQWFENGSPISSATNQTLSLPSIQFANAGLYSVVVSSPYGSVTNSPAQVVVNPAGVSLGVYSGILIDGVVGYTYSVQMTASLSETNTWITLTNLTLQQTPQLWVDTSTNIYHNSQRYYRVVPPQ